MDSSAAASGPLAGAGGRPLTAEDFVVLNDEIRAFVRAGIPLDIGLRGTAERSRGALRQIADDLAQRLQMGASLEDILTSQHDRLPGAYRAVLLAGLRTGRLDDVLQSLSELAEATTSLRRQLRLSLIYPAIIFILAYGLFVAFVMFIVPRLQWTYEIFQIAESPWVRTLLWLHRTLSVWAVAIPAIIIGLWLLSWLSRILLRDHLQGFDLGYWMPGRRDLSLARFSRVLSLLVEYGVPLPEGLQLSGQSAGDVRIERAARQLSSSISAGQSFDESLDQAVALPAFLRWLISVGHFQGSLAASLRQATTIYEQRALTKLEWFRRIVPPVTVILCCGSITLLYGLTLFLPLTEMVRKLGMG